MRRANPAAATAHRFDVPGVAEGVGVSRYPPQQLMAMANRFLQARDRGDPRCDELLDRLCARMKCDRAHAIQMITFLSVFGRA
jgi:hypothetical protein